MSILWSFGTSKPPVSPSQKWPTIMSIFSRHFSIFIYFCSLWSATWRWAANLGGTIWVKSSMGSDSYCIGCCPMENSQRNLIGTSSYKLNVPVSSHSAVRFKRSQICLQMRRILPNEDQVFQERNLKSRWDQETPGSFCIFFLIL